MWSACLLLVALSVGQIGIVASQSCSAATEGASFYLDPKSACEAEPQCYCDYSPAGFYYSSCIDTRRHCSALDPDVCGTQLAIYMYIYYPYFTDYGVTYEWTYDGTTRGETLRYQFNSADETCAVVIIDEQKLETECSCRLITCNGESDPSFLYAQIDCSNYESGAIADECLPNMGVETGSVLEGLAVAWTGLCVSGGAVESPVTAPPPTDGSSPTQAPSRTETIPITTPPPSPPPSDVNLIPDPTQSPSSAETIPITTPPPSPPPSAAEIRPAPTETPPGEYVRTVPTRAPLGDSNPEPAPSGGDEGDGADIGPTPEPFPSASSGARCTFSAAMALAGTAVGAWVGAMFNT
jgi:hypothetical protein